MHLTHVRKSDLNLLPALALLLEERSISRAAARHHLSQPAMSRVLQRLRETFADELLVRTAHGYELTARARRLQQDLQSLLPEVAARRDFQSALGRRHLPRMWARLCLHSDRLPLAGPAQGDGPGYAVGTRRLA
jgi:DNA-binding transcriptional LysR family regulator